MHGEIHHAVTVHPQFADGEVQRQGERDQRTSVEGCMRQVVGTRPSGRPDGADIGIIYDELQIVENERVRQAVVVNAKSDKKDERGCET